MRPILLTLVLVATLAGCPDEQFQQADPQAALQPSRPCEHAPAGNVLPCHDFGLARANSTIESPLAAIAMTTAPVSIESIRFEGADAAFFSVAVTLPAVVSGASRLDFAVRFAPTFTPDPATHAWTTTRESYSAQLVAVTDDPQHPEIRALLVGTAGVAAVRSNPDRISFGRVPLAGTASRRVTLENKGDFKATASAPPTLDEAARAAGFAFASSANVASLEPAAAVSFDLSFTPTTTGPATGSLLFESDDPTSPLVVPLEGEAVANEPPRACLGLSKVFSRFHKEKARETDGSFFLEPFNRAVVTARPASDHAANPTCGLDSADPEGDPVILTWGALEAPADSRGALSPASPLVALSPWQRELFVDTTGDYAVPISVQENNGVGLTTPARGTWHAGARGITVSLDWTAVDHSTEKVDLDLHLVRPAWAGETFAEPRVCRGALGPDCYWSNCKLATAGVPPVDWGATGPDDAASGGTAEALARDPLLNRDSTGTAPLLENMSIGLPAAGDYQLYLHFFEDRRAARPGQVPWRVTIMFAETAAATLTGTLSAERALLHVATLHWTGTAAGSTVEARTAPATTLASCAE